MNPLKFKQAMDYLTRIKKIKPDLPDVFPASQAPMPPKKESIKTMEAINRFVRDNPRTEKAGGGIVKLAGAGSGPPPKSGPTPHGLPYIAKNVRPIKERK